RKPERDRGAPAVLAPHPHAAVVAIHDPVDHGQPEPGPLRSARGEEGVEDPPPHVFGHSLSGIRDVELRAAIRPPRGQSQTSAAGPAASSTAASPSRMGPSGARGSMSWVLPNTMARRLLNSLAMPPAMALTAPAFSV